MAQKNFLEFSRSRNSLTYNKGENKMTKFKYEKIDTTFKSKNYTGDEIVVKDAMKYEYEFLKDHIEIGKIYLTKQEKEIW